jgi:ATP-dependent RNA helicase DDX46/PRP5
MKIQKAATPPPAGGRSNDPLARVAAAAASIGNRLGKASGTKPGVPIDNHGPDAGAFHATLEVNDFPQKARWSVTNRTNVSKVLETTGVSITTKGQYYPEGTAPGPNQPPKLYVLVEGDTERQVEAAMGDLTRYLKKGTIEALESEAAKGTGGRYTVV